MAKGRMKLSRANDLADLGASVHGVDCDLFDLPRSPPNLMAGIQTDREDLISYARALRPSYDRLGRIIGQLAGLFILARLSGRFTADWEAVTRVIDQVNHTEGDLRAVCAPAGAVQHYAVLLQVFDKVAGVTRSFNKTLNGRGRLSERLDEWTRELKLAGAMLSGAAVERLGLLPVDFSQACCSCAASTTPH
jgi:hypothetical protein